MSTLFTKIIRGEIPCFKLREDDHYLAFMDIRPINPGHVLVIPKQEVDYLFDLPDETLSGLMVFAKPVAKAIEQVVPCTRVGVIVAGLEVPHAHVHLIPFDEMVELDFARARQANMAELEQLAEKIRSHV